MAVANMPSGFQQPQRIFGPDFQKRLWRGFDLNQPTILKFNRVAIVQHRGLVEVEEKFEALFAAQSDAATVPPFMVKTHGVNNPLCFNGGFTDDGNGTLHQKIPFQHNRLKP
jgi:hypothetical protein